MDTAGNMSAEPLFKITLIYVSLSETSLLLFALSQPSFDRLLLVNKRLEEQVGGASVLTARAMFLT